MQKRLSHTIGSVIKDLAQRFESANLYYGHGTDNAYDEAAWLVLHILGKSLYEECDATEFVESPALESIETIAQQRIETNKPLAYLLQSSWFCGLEFYIDERALIPRSPIAELILNDFSPWLSVAEAPIRILDMCTGSACIAIASAIHMSDATVDAVDISQDALDIAQINIDKHGVQDRVLLHQGDGFQALSEPVKYDLILCNPPYVDQEDMDSLPSEYLHEPQLALASGYDGLDFTRRFFADVKSYLKPEGGVILEVGNSAAALESAFPDIEKIWLEFDHGGEGVCFISMANL